MKRKWTTPKIDRDEIGRISDDIFSTGHKKTGDIALVFEEIASNIAKHAYKGCFDKKPMHFELQISKFFGNVTMTFFDYGEEFDPTKYDLCAPVPTQVGGHGLRIVRCLSKEMEYRRMKKPPANRRKIRL